jgi:hypothetical protein
MVVAGVDGYREAANDYDAGGGGDYDDDDDGDDVYYAVDAAAVDGGDVAHCLQLKDCFCKESIQMKVQLCGGVTWSYQNLLLLL